MSDGGRFLPIFHFVISRSVATRNPCPEQSEGSFRLLTCVRRDRGEVEMTQSIVFKDLEEKSNMNGLWRCPDTIPPLVLLCILQLCMILL